MKRAEERRRTPGLLGPKRLVFLPYRFLAVSLCTPYPNDGIALSTFSGITPGITSRDRNLFIAGDCATTLPPSIQTFSRLISPSRNYPEVQQPERDPFPLNWDAEESVRYRAVPDVFDNAKVLSP